MAPDPVEVGTVGELETAAGYAYIQYVHDDDGAIKGELVRVLPGTFRVRPDDLDALASGPELFWQHLLFRQGVDEGEIRPAGVAAVPDHARRRPVLRSTARHPVTGALEPWQFYDGVRSWSKADEDLTDEERDLSIDGYVAVPGLIDRIECGWRPSDYPEPLEGPAREARSDVVHYLYFADRRALDAAAAEIAKRLPTASFSRERHRGEWTLLVSVPRPDDGVEDLLGRVAGQTGGEYDGSEVRIG